MAADNQIFRNFINKFRRSEQYAAYIASTSISALHSEIEILNKEQISKGLGSNDEGWGEYTDYWAQERIEAGLQSDVVDLKFTSKFYDSIHVEGEMLDAKTPEIKFDADSERLENLALHGERFEKALGLNEESRNKVGMMIALEIQKELLKYYQG
jgi:hypothetical protein